jgi:hypothetical protein
VLPRKIPKAAKRSSRWKSQAHCSFVRGHECSVAGCSGRPIEVAHVRLGSGAGMAQKPDDWRTVSLCQKHHALQHNRGEAWFWDEYAQRDIEALIDAFCKASPKAGEIARIRKEKESG